MNASLLKVGKADVKTFFEGACASYLAANPERSRAAGGSLAFNLKGAAGGVWTVDLDKARVIKGLAKADVTLYANALDFDAVFSGKRSAASAFADGSMRCEGDVNTLVRFASLLADKR